MNHTIPASPLYNRIYALVRQIPPGRVTTYGHLARQIGCTARTVGFAMAALPAGHDLPWQRVINSQGKVSPRRHDDGAIIQRQLLEAEGVRFDSRGRVDLSRYGEFSRTSPFSTSRLSP
jgi:methylated-DNA-protein-cysteine methyltransferase-like protein